MSLLETLFGVKEKSSQKTKLSTQEGHHLWNLCNMYYMLSDNINRFSSHIHDEDFKYLIEQHKEYFQGEINDFEKLMSNYGIKSPKPATIGNIKAKENTELTQDSDIAQTEYIFLRTVISIHIKMIKDTLFSDSLREFFMESTKESMEMLDDYVEYLKMKNWIEYPPLYEDAPVEEEVSANEVYHLWEHLNYRYTNINQTRIFISFVQDDDFKVILSEGLETLQQQITKLENKLTSLSSPLPQKFPENLPAPENRNIIGDEYIFNMILNGMQNAAFLHGSSIQEMIVNKEIREFFHELLFAEMDMIDKMIKYGKTKGWLPNVPKLTHSP